MSVDRWLGGGLFPEWSSPVLFIKTRWTYLTSFSPGSDAATWPEMDPNSEPKKIRSIDSFPFPELSFCFVSDFRRK
jgi:hypothetical protein